MPANYVSFATVPKPSFATSASQLGGPVLVEMKTPCVQHNREVCECTGVVSALPSYQKKAIIPVSGGLRYKVKEAPARAVEPAVI